MEVGERVSLVGGDKVLGGEGVGVCLRCRSVGHRVQGDHSSFFPKVLASLT